MDTVYVKPGEGARIRQPERNGRVMPEVGDRVPRDTYYERLIISGDVVEIELPNAAPEPQSAPDEEHSAAQSQED